MSSYFVPRPSFKWPRLAFRSSRHTIRREALIQSLGWLLVAALVVGLGTYGFTLTSESKWAQAGFSSIVAVAIVLYVWFLWSTWVDDGRHDTNH
jgi:hypothetical protein